MLKKVNLLTIGVAMTVVNALLFAVGFVYLTISQSL
jgi:hypothetical protein